MKLMVAGLTLAWCGLLAADDPLRAAVDGDHRSAAFSERDGFRHPYETLSFFKVEPAMTVVEIWPAGGWYTEILAPYLKDEGVYYAAHFSADAGADYYRISLEGFKEKTAADPALYGEVKLVAFDPENGLLGVPEGSADRVLTFRNVHNWSNQKSDHLAFRAFFDALKPGGILGVVEHRANPGTPFERMVKTGYMTEAYVIGLAEAAGFKFLEKSEINANPLDTTDHPNGVWTLPPVRRGQLDPEKYNAIGESDRMTLKFRKPE